MPRRQPSEAPLANPLTIRLLTLCPLLLAACGHIAAERVILPEPGRWVQEDDPSPSAYDLVFYHEDEAYFRDRPASLETVNAIALRQAGGLGAGLRFSYGLGETEGMVLPPPSAESLGWPSNKPALSPGDRLLLRIENGEEFSGTFEVDVDGSLNLPFLPPIQVAGRSLFQARQMVTEALIHAGYFRRDLLAVSLLVQEWSTIQVNVGGAVFAPGMVSINVRRAEDRALRSNLVSGDYPSERFVSAALRSAGGVRPDADLSRVMLVRQGQTMRIDLSGIPAGLGGDRQALISGDQLIVPSTGRFDEGLARPSAVTPPGIRVFMSNLTVPATDNSKSAINNFSSGLPYGTRFLSGLISANCVGGTSAVNSRRFGVLVTRNPLTGETEVIQRQIHQLLNEPEKEALNPHLMPNDGIACYDSGVTNLRDIGRTIADIISPFR